MPALRVGEVNVDDARARNARRRCVRHPDDHVGVGISVDVAVAEVVVVVEDRRDAVWIRGRS
ncbi:MAG: hypothetical protein ACJ72A_18735 [Nocardioidaceae bacterium]